MNDPKENLARRIGEFLDQYGIDSVYASTIFVILIALSYRKDLKKWDKLEGWRKGIILSAFLTAFVFSIISLLKLLGAIDL